MPAKLVTIAGQPLVSEIDAALESAMKDALNTEPADLADASQKDRLHALTVRHRAELAARGLYVGKTTDLSALQRMAEDVAAEAAAQIERGR